MLPGPTLVILAAGIGCRCGEEKQIAVVGPGGEWLLEYAIHDALAAGFTRMLRVIRTALRETSQHRLAPQLRRRGELHLVEQPLGKVLAVCRVPAERSKPLGTRHALWCCKDLLTGPFAVINADHYYGRNAFHLLVEHFHRAGPAMVGYPLQKSLSPHGGVNRGVCRIGRDGHLADAEEFVDIRSRDGALRGRSHASVDACLEPDTLVSLNCRSLLPDLLRDLESGLVEFLRDAANDGEYFLPAAIDRHLARAGERIAVLRGESGWPGATYPQDRPHVAARLAAMHAADLYPTPLWRSGGR